MPTYTFRNKDNEDEFTEIMKISEMEQVLEENPELELVPASPLISSGVGSVHTRTSNGWNDVLLEMKKRHRHSTIRTK